MSLLIDVLILSLLVATIGYAFLVERRVRKLMHALSELYPAVTAFSAAVDRSEGSVLELRTLAEPLADDKKRDADRSMVRSRLDAGTPQFKHAAGVFKVPEKAELIRSFFESAREKQA